MVPRACTRTRASAPAGLHVPIVAALVALVALGGLGSLGAPRADARSLPPVPAGAVVSSNCARMTISPRVVELGQSVTAVAGPATARCGGPATTVTWNWDAFSAGAMISGCGVRARQCVKRADAPTTAWRRACIQGGSPFGSWRSCDVYFVLDHLYELSGRITGGSTGVGAAGVRVRASCSGGATTTTDAAGDYNFLLHRGACTIAPLVQGGETSTPTTRRVNVSRSITGVDFQVASAAQ